MSTFHPCQLSQVQPSLWITGKGTCTKDSFTGFRLDGWSLCMSNSVCVCVCECMCMRGWVGVHVYVFVYIYIIMGVCVCV